VKRYLLIILFFLNSCKNIIIDNEQVFYYKAKMNLYSFSDKHKVIQNFLEYSYSEKKAKEAVMKKCEKFIESNYLKNVKCKFIRITHTEKLSTSLD
jgi:hypothetical protein